MISVQWSEDTWRQFKSECLLDVPFEVSDRLLDMIEYRVEKTSSSGAVKFQYDAQFDGMIYVAVLEIGYKVIGDARLIDTYSGFIHAMPTLSLE